MTILFYGWIASMLISTVGFLLVLVRIFRKQSTEKYLHVTTALSWIAVFTFAIGSAYDNKSGGYIALPEVIMAIYSPVCLLSTYWTSADVLRRKF